ncbi:hypothetical protein, partial [Dyella sp. ASV21]|uniref:hypothetical protein n=1 Tax=Dyella sp. ASV21 TaxID=2795114 RepID=UPI001E334481
GHEPRRRSHRLALGGVRGRPDDRSTGRALSAQWHLAAHVAAGAPEYFHAQVRPTRMEAGRPVLKFGLPSAAQENQVVWTWIGA